MHRVLGLGGERRERRFHAVRAPRRGIADVELVGLEGAAGEERNVADLLHRVAGEDRLRRFETHRQVGRVRRYVDGKEIRPRSDERDERHHELFADRIDRRIRHLGEELLEITVEHLRPVRQHRQCGIVAHRADRFLARLRHRTENDLEVFLRVAERLLAIEQRHFGMRRRCRFRQVVECNPRALDPGPVGLRRCERPLELGVVDDATLLGVDEQHLARLQPPLLDDLALGDVEHADLGGHHHVVVVGDDEPCRPQAVAVERCADLPAVGEGHRRRTVPRLHQRSVVFVERAAVLVHQRIAGPRFGNHQHHRVGERIAAHDQQLEAIVERRRVRLAVVDQRPDLVEVATQHRARDSLLARADPVDVAAQRVDLAVVADEAEWMCQVPRRKRVGRETLVHHCQRRHHALVLEIKEIFAHLVREQHPLVDERARRHRRDVELLPVAELQRLDRVAGLLADDVELALERVLVHVVRPARDEDLPDHRLDLLGAQRQPAVVGGNVAPAEEDLALACHRTLDFLFARHPRRRFLGQEHHAHAVLADRRQRQALASAGAAQKCIGKLDQDAGAIALQRIRTGRAAMGEVFQDRETLRDDRVTLAALDVGDEPQAARIALVRRIVETLAHRGKVTLVGESFVHGRPHGSAESTAGRTKRSAGRFSRKYGETYKY